MSIMFDKVAHTYTDTETGQMLPSVNQIINSVYGSGVAYIRRDILDAAANRGTEIHNEIDLSISMGQIVPDAKEETIAFFEWASTVPLHLDECRHECILSVAGKFAGTADLICDYTLFDYKTSKNKPAKKMLAHWQMQLSFYWYAIKYKLANLVDLQPKLVILHLSGNKCTPIELEYLGDDFVERTLEAYYNGETLQETKEVSTELQTIDNKTLVHFGAVLAQIATLEKEIEPIREKIKEEMEKRSILSLDIGNVGITYIAPTNRKSFDSGRFKAEHADLYAQNQKETPVKSSISIKIK